MIKTPQAKTVVLMVLTLCLAGSVSAGTVSYWQLDESGNTFVDAVNGYNMSRDLGSQSTDVAADPIPNPDPGPFSTGTPADNPNSQLNFSAHRSVGSTVNTNFAMTDSSSWTLELFFKAGTQSGWGFMAGTRQYTGTWRGYQIKIGTDGKVDVYLQAGDLASQKGEIFKTTGRYDDNEWHHLAMTWDHNAGANGTVTLFIDQDQVGQAAGFGDLNETINHVLAIGARDSGGNRVYTNDPVEGLFDEARFSDEVLSPDEFLVAPEPTSMGLLAVGGLVALRRRRR